MRTLIGALAAALMLSTIVSTAAFAAEAEGKIKTIDRDNLTITLDNGKSYKLPGEFDVDAIKEGMEIAARLRRGRRREPDHRHGIVGVAHRGSARNRLRRDAVVSSQPLQPRNSSKPQHAVLGDVQGRGFVRRACPRPS